MKFNDEEVRAEVKTLFAASIEVERRVSDECVESILAAAQLLVETFQSGGKVLLCGNGGSAADCQHMAAELVNRLTAAFERPGLPAVALTTDTSFITAYSNDFGYRGVFERQVQVLGKPDDVLIAISTSGNSANVLRAAEAARSADMRVIGLTGRVGRLKEIADIAIVVPSNDTQRIQEAHLLIEHILCHLVERNLFWKVGNLGG